MIIGVCTVSLYLPTSSSLKDKRNILKSLKARIRNNYNVSVSEINHYDLWKNTVLGFSCIGNDKKYLNQIFNKIILFLSKENDFDIIKFEINIL